jgi:amino acid permease
MIGCCETAEYIIYVAESALLLAQMLVNITNCSPSLQPVICLLFYLSALFVYIYGNGRSWFWRFNLGLCIVSLLILVVFILGGAKYADFDTHAGGVSFTDDYAIDHSRERVWFAGGMREFVKILPLTAWFFVGVESLSFACNETDKVCKRVRVDSMRQRTLRVGGCVHSHLMCCYFFFLLYSPKKSYPGAQSLAYLPSVLRLSACCL